MAGRILPGAEQERTEPATSCNSGSEPSGYLASAEVSQDILTRRLPALSKIAVYMRADLDDAMLREIVGRRADLCRMVPLRYSRKSMRSSWGTPRRSAMTRVVKGRPVLSV
jgi:hypothetical protein